MILLLQNSIIFLILLLIFYISRRKIEHGVCLIVFLLPVYLIRTEIFSIPTTALELGIYALFSVWLYRTYYSGQLGKTMNIIFSDRLFIAGAFLLISGAAISTIFSVDLKTSAGILKGWFFDPLLFFIVLVSAIKTYEQKVKVLTCFFASGAVVGAVSLVYWLFPFLSGISYDGRLHAFYDSPNYLAMYLAPALIVGIWLMIFLRKSYYNIVAVAIVALALYFTFSYAAWVSVFFAVVLFFGLSVNKTPSFHWKLGVKADSKNSFSKKIFLFGAIFTIFSAAILAQLGTSKLENLENMSYRSSYNSRLMIWRAAWEIGKDNPLVGIGPGNFQRYYLDYQSRVLGIEPYLEWAVPEPHNIFLAFWLQTGILGLAGFIVLIFWFFKKIFSLFKKTRLDLPASTSSNLGGTEAKRARDAGFRGVAIALSLIMIYTLLHGLVDTTYWKNDLAIIFWMVLGLVAAIKNNSGETA